MAKARANAKELNLRLVSNFSAKSYPYKHSIDLAADNSFHDENPEECLKAIQFYIHKKTKELAIEDYKVFTQDDGNVDILFTNSADYEDFTAAFEARSHQTIELHLKTARFNSPRYLENVTHELTELAWQFGMGNDVRFEVSHKNAEAILMIAQNREAYTNFLREYEREKGTAHLSLLIDPETIPYLMP